jgi:hypothetical protein
LTYQVDVTTVGELLRQGDMRMLLSDAAGRQSAMMRERRAAVLRHPDLAARLTGKPLNLTTPEKWTGFVPPASREGKQQEQRNDSPYRAQLVAIVEEAQQRDGRNYGLGVTGE